MYRRGGLRVANASSKWAPVQPGISCRMRSLLLHGKSSPLEMLPQPHRTQERGEMTGKGSGQAELLVTPADTNQRGTLGSVVHLRSSPENGTTLQEEPSRGDPQTLHTKTPRCRNAPLCRTQHNSIWHTNVALHITAKQRYNNNNEPDSA